MKTKNLLSLLALLFPLIIVVPNTALAVDLGKIEKDLGTTGVEGWIHGASKETGMFVFTYREPGNFFDHIEMSLVSDNMEIKNKIESFSRHDKVRVKGAFLKNPSPQKHIDVTSIEVVKKHESQHPTEAYKYDARLPDELLKTTNANFLVHAIAGEGKILVLEYRDAVVPVFVKNPEFSKNLSRNDLIQLSYVIQAEPGRPMHLRLDEKAAEPVKVIENIRALHGKPASVEGALIMFPKSPEIVFNIFAVQQELPDGLKRQYTLLNMDDSAVFAKIRAKLQAAWDKHGKDYVNGRNKLVSRRIRVKATGTFNEVSPNQANPQILLKSADQIEIIEN